MEKRVCWSSLRGPRSWRRRSIRWPPIRSDGRSSAAVGASACRSTSRPTGSRGARWRSTRSCADPPRDPGARNRRGGADPDLGLPRRAGRGAAGPRCFAAAPPGPWAPDPAPEPFPLPLVRRKPWRLPAAALAVRRAVRASQPDVIHAYNPTMALAVGLATRRPGLVNLQGSAEDDWPGTVRLVRLSRLAPVACGPGVAAALEDHGLQPFATVPNAVGPAPPPGERIANVVAVGRLVEQKNHELAIRAIAQVPAATLAIVGDGPLRPELERLAAELEAPVIFTGVRSDARALMGAADVVVMPSRWEGLPLSALEALASDRKSTRLNSSHGYISYAVFCLKKK